MNFKTINAISDTQTLAENHGFILTRDGATRQYTGALGSTYTPPYVIDAFFLEDDMSNFESSPLDSNVVNEILSEKEILFKISNSFITNYDFMLGFYNSEASSSHYIFFVINQFYDDDKIIASVKIPDSDVSKWPFGWNSNFGEVS